MAAHTLQYAFWACLALSISSLGESLLPFFLHSLRLILQNIRFSGLAVFNGVSAPALPAFFDVAVSCLFQYSLASCLVLER